MSVTSTRSLPLAVLTLCSRRIVRRDRRKDRLLEPALLLFGLRRSVIIGRDRFGIRTIDRQTGDHTTHLSTVERFVLEQRIDETFHRFTIFFEDLRRTSVLL